MKDYQHYIFDFDGTLFDTRQGLINAYREAFKAVDFPFKPSDALLYAKEPLAATFNRFRAESSYIIQQVQFCNFRTAFMSAEACYDWTSTSIVFPDVHPCIERLASQHKNISIVSGNPYAQIASMLENTQLQSYFNTIVAYEDYLQQKPAADSLNVCLSRIHVNPHDCVYIGDSMNDILAADNAGIDSMLIIRDTDYSYDKTAYKGVHTIASLSELLNAAEAA